MTSPTLLPFDFDLPDLIQKVQAGFSLKEAHEIINSLEHPPNPDASWSVDDLRGRVLLREQLAVQILHLLEWVAGLNGADTVHALGGLLSAASGRIHASLLGWVTATVANRLLDLERPDLALQLFSSFPVEDLNETAALEREYLRLRCLNAQGSSHCPLEATQDLLASARRVGAKRGVIACLWLVAEVAAKRNPASSIVFEVLDEAISLRSQCSVEDAEGFSFMPFPPASTLWATRGLRARNARRFEESLLGFERARELAQSEGNLRFASFVLSEIGITWQFSGEPERGQEILKRSAEEARKLGDTRAVLRWAGELDALIPNEELNAADRLSLAGRQLTKNPPDYVAAKHLALEALAGARESGDSQTEAMARNLLAGILGQQGHTYQARMAWEAAIDPVQRSGRQDLELIIRGNLGLVLINLGYPDLALEQLVVASRLGQKLRSMASSSEFRKALGARLTWIFEALILLRVAGWGRGDLIHDKDTSCALELCQQAKSLNLANWLALREQESYEWVDSPLRRAIRQMCKAEVALERAALNSKPLAAQFEALDQSTRSLHELMAAAGRSLPIGDELLSEEELRRSLRNKDAVLEFFVADEWVFFVWVPCVGPTRSDFISWKRGQRLAWLNRWEAALTAASQSGLTDAQTERRWRFNSDPLNVRAHWVSEVGSSSINDLLGELREHFLGPLFNAIGEALVQNVRLFIAPHLELNRIPFWALECFAPELLFSIVPSARCLPFLFRRKHEPGRKRFKVGDCTNSLPFSDWELSRLSQHELLPPRIPDLLALGGEAGGLHFAGHGYFDGVNPYNSGLILAASPGDNVESDLFISEEFEGLPVRRLTVSGVLTEMDLRNCYLVTLAACCSGLPDLHPAGEFTGLPAAFTVAGARNVIGSIWPVHDMATALLMEHFYSLLDQGIGPAAALKDSRRWLSKLAHEEVVERLGPDPWIPPGPHPFESPWFHMAFQAYGVD